MRRKVRGEVFIAPMDVYLDEHNCLQPDLLILKTENESKVGEKFNGTFESRLVASRDEACVSLLFPELKIDLAKIF